MICVIYVNSISETSGIQINASTQNLRGTNQRSQVIKTLVNKHFKVVQGSQVLSSFSLCHFSLSPICKIITTKLVEPIASKHSLNDQVISYYHFYSIYIYIYIYSLYHLDFSTSFLLVTLYKWSFLLKVSEKHKFAASNVTHAVIHVSCEM